MAAIAVVVLTGLAATAATAANDRGDGPRRARPIAPGSAFVRPPAKNCVTGRSLTIVVRALPRVRWRSVAVSINGRRVRTIRSGFGRPVRLTGLPRGGFVLSITARTTDGRTVTARRTYRTCGGGHAPSPPPPSPSLTLSVTLAGTGVGSVTGSGISCPGTCSHAYASGTTVTLTAAAASGSSFAGWSGAGCAGTGTCAVTMSSAQAVTATFHAAAASVLPGSYTVSTSQNRSGVSTLYVSSDGSHVQDVTIPTFLGCSPAYSSGLDDHLQLASLPIAADGSFTSGPVTDTGVIANSVATYTYTLSGQFSGTKATGTLTETISFNNGVAYSCTTGPQTWSATRDTQGTQTASPPPAGSYTIASLQNRSGVSTLYVSTDGTHLQDITIPTYLSCNPAYNSGIDDHIQIASIAIGSDGSFTSGSVTDHGVIDNAPATYTYTLTGNTHGTTTAGIARIAGQLREDVTFNNGTAISCTTGPQTWSAARDTQGTQTGSPPPAGSYTVASLQNRSGPSTLYASTDGSHLQDITIPTYLTCAPSYNSGIDDHIQIASIPVNPDGSFTTGTVTDTGIIDNAPATYTYTLTGNVHGTNTAGTERIAGQLREDITFDNGTAISCTTGPQTWSATRDTQGTQTASPPPAGSYTIASLQNRSGPSTLYVSTDGSHLQDITIPTYLTCNPDYGEGIDDHIQIASIAIGSDGSFTSGPVTDDGIVDGEPATYTYTLTGDVHGTNTAGTERIAGQLREDITFNIGNLPDSCTTGPQTWSATRDTQGTQTASPPPAGSYTVASLQNRSGTSSFTVSADGTTLQNLTVPTYSSCAPQYPNIDDHITISSIAIGSDGSFDSGPVTASGTIGGHPAMLIYTFTGNFHGTNTAGAERAAGQLREDMSFEDGTAISCTTGPETWSATGP